MAKEKITNNLKVTTLPVSYTAGANVSLRSFAAYRTGNIVVVEVYFNVNASLSNNSAIVNFSSDLPIPVTAYAIASVRSIDGNNSNMAMVSLEAANASSIRTWGAISPGEYYYALLVYVTR